MDLKPVSNSSFDPKQYAEFYTRPEPIVGLDLSTNQKPGELLEVIKGLAIHDELLNRTFIAAGAATHESGVNIRVLQWNILAQGLTGGAENFVKCPPEALEWSYRRLAIMEELLRYNADIICLEEVDHFGFIMPILKNIGYLGVFLPKPNSPALYSNESNGPDGCALFYKSDRFVCDELHNVVLKADEQLTNQMAIFALLKELSSGKQFIIGTTHLKAKDYPEIRQKQGMYILSYLNKLPKLPMIVCGDFNADPSEPVMADFQSSPICIKSAYNVESSDGLAADNKSLYTTYKIRIGKKTGTADELCRCIDYIWYTKDTLTLLNILGIPKKEDIGVEGLPCRRYPSDHLSLVATFML